MIAVEFTNEKPANVDAIVVPVTKEQGSDIDLPFEQSALLKKAAERLDFSGNAGALAGTWLTEGDALIYALLVGVGDGSEEDYLKAGGKIFTRLKGQTISRAILDASGLAGNAGALIAHGAKLRSWSIESYKTRKKKSAGFEWLGIVGGEDADWTRLEAIADGVDFTRELVSEPANVIYPESFVERCSKLSDLGIGITVLDEAQMKELGMGALLGVAQGSARAPRLLAMRWNGIGEAADKPLVLVGKGVTFDTGGISIKPAAGMEDMKWDMGGAATVAGTMRALATRQAKAHVIGICGLVENMPDGKAQRPGDIVTTMSGQTVEVINTDAEGRLVLCDAMSWAQKEFQPEYMIDLATLTGAILVSLAHEYAGLFTNDDTLAEMLESAGKSTGDRVWRFPLGPAYDKMLESQIADMKNVGPRYGGSITAAQYLQRFVEKGVKWAHLDIAGTVWTAKAGDLWEKGATGFGVRLLDKLVADHFEK